MSPPTPMMAPPDHGLPSLLLMLPQQKGKDARNQEEDDVHDAKRPTRFQHGTILVEVGAPLPTVTALTSIIPKDPEININVARGKVGATGVGNGAQLVDASDERANKGEVD